MTARRISLIFTTVFALFAAAVGLPTQASAALPIYMKNVSTINISITTTNPATGGSIYAVRPGSAATGMGFYAACGRATVYWLPGQSVKVARACAWNYPAYSNSQYTIRSV